MIVFAVETDKSLVVDRYVSVSRSRFDFGFSGKINVIERSDKLFVVVGLDALFPPLWRYVSLCALLASCAVYIVLGFFSFFFLLPVFVPLCFELCLLSDFHAQLFVKGLRKFGYSGSCRVVSRDELLRFFVYHGSN